MTDRTTYRQAPPSERLGQVPTKTIVSMIVAFRTCPVPADRLVAAGAPGVAALRRELRRREFAVGEATR